MTPRISVVMPVYNSAAYLPEAIDSILNQTYGDFEFIIVDDGSQDATPTILARYQEQESRIIVDHQENQGVTAALRHGWELSSGRYIARMDADDVSMPARFEQQVAFLDAHPEVGVVGAWVKTLGGSHDTIWRHPTTHQTIRAQLLFGSVMAHPSVMMDKALFEGARLQYDSVYKGAQDYALWVEASNHFCLANLPKVLLRYRLHSRQIRESGVDNQQATVVHVQAQQLMKLGIVPTPDESRLHSSVHSTEAVLTPDYLDQVEEWLLRLDKSNRQTEVYPLQLFSHILANYWLKIGKRAVKTLGAGVIPRISQFPLMSLSFAGRKAKNAILIRFGLY